MRRLLSEFLLLVILFLLLLRTNIQVFAQSVNPSVSPSPSPACDKSFWEGAGDTIKNLVGGLFGISAEMSEVNKASLPYGSLTDRQNPFCEKEADVVTKASKSYEIGRATKFGEPVAAKSSFLEEIAKKITGVFESGNKEAEDFLKQALPVEAGNQVIARLNSEEDKEAVAQNQDLRVLGTKATKDKAMIVSLPMLQCASLPYGVGDCAGSGSPVGTPTVSPPTVSPSPGGGGSVGTCSYGSGDCSVENLKGYFGGDENKAKKASQICQAESASNSLALNDGCLKGKSCDYSVGLFQINMLAQCKDAFRYECDREQMRYECTILNQTKLDECVRYYEDAANNIKKAAEMSGGGTNWSDDWGKAAKQCGIE